MDYEFLMDNQGAEGIEYKDFNFRREIDVSAKGTIASKREVNRIKLQRLQNESSSSRSSYIVAIGGVRAKKASVMIED